MSKVSGWLAVSAHGKQGHFWFSGNAGRKKSPGSALLASPCTRNMLPKSCEIDHVCEIRNQKLHIPLAG